MTSFYRAGSFFLDGPIIYDIDKFVERSSLKCMYDTSNAIF